MNTQTYKYFIDFAASYGLEYILLDEGWSAGTWNIRESNKDINIQELARYGKEKNVGIILWALWNPLSEDIEGILELYRQWGIKGVKIDFMQRNDQEMVNFYEEVGKIAFEKQLLVDFHGSFKPSGLHRKYPNVMTCEGVYGLEHNKSSHDITPDHDLILPFTRMVAGPMDYTPGATVNATENDFHMNFIHPMSQGTRAHQGAVNMTGCFLIGLLSGWMLAHQPENRIFRLLFMVGFFGGYTIFSTFAFENLRLIETNQWGLFTLYTFMSVVVGLLAVWGGMKLVS